MTARLSAAMIVRDEATMLGDCLQSLRGFADEVVVVDTGSTDGTPDIAAALGARLVTFPWRGDFAAARNEALGHARGRWILYVDADERVGPVPPAEREALLADESVVAYTVRFRPRTGFTRYREYRIFRNDPRIRFRGVIHETMLSDIMAVGAADGLRIAPSTVTIDHLGYDGDQRLKRLRDIPLLRARLVDDTDHVYSWNHLAHALDDLGDHVAARAAWVRGIEVARHHREASAFDSLPYLALIQRDMARGADVTALLDEAVARFPGNHLVSWLRGRALMAGGRFAEALPIFAALEKIDAEGLVEDRLGYDARIFGVWATASLALCWFRLGQYEESARQYARAEALAPEDPSHAVRRRLAEARARRAMAAAPVTSSATARA